MARRRTKVQDPYIVSRMGAVKNGLDLVLAVVASARQVAVSAREHVREIRDLLADVERDAEDAIDRTYTDGFQDGHGEGYDDAMKETGLNKEG